VTPETSFKVIFVIAFVVAVGAASATARRATARHGGTLNQLTHELRALIVIRAVLGLVFYAALITWLFLPSAFTWAYFAAPMALRWAAAVLLIPVLLFFVWSFRSIGANYRGGVGLYDDHALVTTGAYGLCRHPIYAAFISIMLLVFVMSANWVLGLSGLLLVTSIAAFRIPIEERELRERFGAEWEHYRARAGRLVPRVRA
jgi:protein-S-isoprenylcysteine O-methyltransferase Ste14